MPEFETCPWKIRYGTSAETTSECTEPPGHIGVAPGNAGKQHRGHGLLPEQVVTWLAADRREYTGDWPGYCGGSSFEDASGTCVLPAGHPNAHAP